MKIFQCIIIGIVIVSGCSKKGSDSLSLEQFGFKDKEPLILYDNEKISVEKFMTLKTDSIGSIRVLRNDAARELYGAAGIDGVIVITSASVRANEEQTALNLLQGYLAGKSELENHLFIIDGVPLNNENKSEYFHFDISKIKSISSLGTTTAKSLYGSRAREYNYVIRTKE